MGERVVRELYAKSASKSERGKEWGRNFQQRSGKNYGDYTRGGKTNTTEPLAQSNETAT